MSKIFFIPHGFYAASRNDRFWRGFYTMRKDHEASFQAFAFKVFLGAFIFAGLVLALFPE